MLTETLSCVQGKFGPGTRRPWVFRIVRGVLWRLARRARVTVLRAPHSDVGPACPDGCSLFRVADTDCAADRNFANDAMRAAGEPLGLVAPRFAHGDEFFGWMVGGRVVSFGWVTCQDRTVGPFQLAEVPERAFLYNFHTLEEYRGQGFYPALLLAVRHVLGRENLTEFVLDVNVRNSASVRGIEKAGFVPVAHVAFLTLFDRWCCFGSRTLMERSSFSLFRTV